LEKKKAWKDVRKAERKSLREVTVKIGLERTNIQKGIIVEVLLNSRTTILVMSSEFARKQGFKLKKIEKLIYIRNIDGTFNKEKLIENTVEVNIYYQWHRERTKRDQLENRRR